MRNFFCPLSAPKSRLSSIPADNVGRAMQFNQSIGLDVKTFTLKIKIKGKKL